MNEEIKEMSKEELFLLDLKCSTEPTLTEKGKDLLLDYITNLQNRITELEEINKQHQELNAKLRDELETMTFTAKIKQEAIDSLIKRIDKAIEYVKCMPYLEETDKEYEDMDGNTYFTYKKWDESDLLNILQDKEEV